jgi:phosphoserine phosphatase RsbU/P
MTASPEPNATPPARAIQCLEVWGGNDPVETAISVPGIDAWVYSAPASDEELGGDIYYVTMCEGSRIARFAVADVAGHGHLAAELGTSLRGLMRKHINKLNQTKFAQALNREFNNISGSLGFATALLATYFSPEDRLIICNIGHPEPIWYRAATGEWQLLRDDKPDRRGPMVNVPLGVVQPTVYTQFSVTLEPGDLVLVHTDWLTEAQDDTGIRLGVEGLLALLRERDVGRPGKLIRSILDAVQARGEGRDAEDDRTLILLHHNGSRPPPLSLGERAKMMMRMLGLLRE